MINSGGLSGSPESRRPPPRLYPPYARSTPPPAGVPQRASPRGQATGRCPGRTPGPRRGEQPPAPARLHPRRRTAARRTSTASRGPPPAAAHPRGKAIPHDHLHPPAPRQHPHTPIRRKAALTAAGLAFTGGAIAGPIALATAAPRRTHPHQAPPPWSPPTTATPRHGTAARTAASGDGKRPGKPAARTSAFDYQAQPNFYYCGPAATRIALTATGQHADPDQLAHDLGTTEAGTNSRRGHHPRPEPDHRRQQVRHHRPARQPRHPGPDGPTPGRHHHHHRRQPRPRRQHRRHRHRHRRQGPLLRPGGHYITVVGYRDDGRQAHIADPANPNAASYWVSTIDLANWMATHGYSH